MYLIGGGSPLIDDLMRRMPRKETGPHPQVAYVSACSESLISEIMRGGDLDADSLIIACIEPPSVPRLTRFLRDLDEVTPDQVPRSSEEAIQSLGDGELLQWLNPRRTSAEILQTLDAIARSVGWHVHLADPWKGE